MRRGLGTVVALGLAACGSSGSGQVTGVSQGGGAVAFEAWQAEFARFDIVVATTAAPHYVLDREKLTPLMKLRRNRPLLLIDITVPRNIEPEVNFLENVYLYNIDDLQTMADGYLKQRQEEVARCEQIICEKAEALLRRGHRPEAGLHRPAFGHK